MTAIIKAQYIWLREMQNKRIFSTKNATKGTNREFFPLYAYLMGIFSINQTKARNTKKWQMLGLAIFSVFWGLIWAYLLAKFNVLTLDA